MREVIKSIVIERIIIIVLMILMLAGTLWAVVDRMNANEQCNVPCQQERLGIQ